MKSYTLGLMWLAAAVILLVAHAVRGEVPDGGYWFMLGASGFWFGIDRIEKAIAKERTR